MKNPSPLVRQQTFAEQQRRASAPMMMNHRLSPPPFALSQTRHSSFNPQHHQQEPIALNPPQRLSIAERFMSSTPPISDLPDHSNDSTTKSDATNDGESLHPLPTMNFIPSAKCGQPHDKRSSFQPKRQSRKPKRSHTDQPPSKRALPSYGENLDMEKAALAPITTKGDRHQHEKNTTMNKEMDGFWYCHRGCLLLCIFFFILVLGFLLFLVWPRVPLLRIEGASVVSPVEIVQTQQGWMENVMFTTSWLVNVTVDNRQNYIPTRLNKVQVIVKDAVTNALVGKGTHNDDNMDWVLMDGISTMSVLVTVNYQARDMSDTTFLDLAHACHRTDLPATSLPLHFWFTLYMFGFDWLGFTPTIIATPASSGFFCPV